MFFMATYHAIECLDFKRKIMSRDREHFYRLEFDLDVIQIITQSIGCDQKLIKGFQKKFYRKSLSE